MKCLKTLLACVSVTCFNCWRIAARVTSQDLVCLRHTIKIYVSISTMSIQMLVCSSPYGFLYYIILFLYAGIVNTDEGKYENIVLIFLVLYTVIMTAI